MEICRLILQERSTNDGQTRQKLLLAHYNTCKDEIIKKGDEKRMFKRKEKQSLIDASRKALKNAEKEVKELTKENKASYEENKELRFENEEQKDLLEVIQEIFG